MPYLRQLADVLVPSLDSCLSALLYNEMDFILTL
jgi:hypothetical protein